MDTKNRRTNTGIVPPLHIGLWLTYWCLELLKISLISIIDNNIWIETFVNLLYGTTFFYILTFFALPKMRRKGVFQLMGRSIFVLCTMFHLGSFLLIAEWADFKNSPVTNIRSFLVIDFDIYFKFGAYAVFVWLFRRQAARLKQVLKNELEKEELGRNLPETKHVAVRAQITPHFLFNALNFIHSKTFFSDEQVVDRPIPLLPDVLCHSLMNSSNSSVSIDEELAQIKKLYELNRLRYEGKYYPNIVVEGFEFRKKNPLLALLTFFENITKYGVFDNPKNSKPSLLHVKQFISNLDIHRENMISRERTINRRTKHALGKRHIKNMLDKYHKSSCQLDYRDDNIFYRVNLKINW